MHKQKAFLITLALAFALLIWLSDSLLHSFLFHEGTFIEVSLTQIPSHKIYSRLLIVLSFLLFAFICIKLITYSEKRIAEMTHVFSMLNQCDEKLKETQKIAKLGSWELDIDTKHLWWSEQTYRLFGFPVGDETAFSKFIEAIHPEDREHVQKKIKKAIATATPLQLDYRIILPDGTIRHLHEESETLVREGRSPKIRRGSVQDITEYKKAEEKRIDLIMELDKAQEEIRSLEGILPICSFCKKIRDKNGNWNQLETYITTHSKADFTHCFCPECANRHYPGFKYPKKQQNSPT